MPYAVVQTGPEPPSAEQLGNAFHQAPGFAQADALVLGKEAYGVLANGLSLEQAQAMQSALASQGVGTEVVDETALPVLPQQRQLSKVSFTVDGLLIDDLIGRTFVFDWNQFAVIAAGRVRMTDFTKELKSRIVGPGMQGRDGPKIVVESVSKEVQKDHLLLEIISRDLKLRYHAKVDLPETALLFTCLGERKTKDAAANLSILAQELTKYAPDAALNHGAFYMRENGDTSYRYVSQTAFYREITWLLWMISSGRTLQ